MNMKATSAAVVAVFLLATAALVVHAQRLPQGAIPLHYELHLTPNLSTDQFQGEERIDVQLQQPTASIHAAGMRTSVPCPRNRFIEDPALMIEFLWICRTKGRTGSGNGSPRSVRLLMTRLIASSAMANAAASSWPHVTISDKSTTRTVPPLPVRAEA